MIKTKISRNKLYHDNHISDETIVLQNVSLDDKQRKKYYKDAVKLMKVIYENM